jgi:hypothetical protein
MHTRYRANAYTIGTQYRIHALSHLVSFHLLHKLSILQNFFFLFRYREVRSDTGSGIIMDQQVSLLVEDPFNPRDNVARTLKPHALRIVKDEYARARSLFLHVLANLDSFTPTKWFQLLFEPAPVIQREINTRANSTVKSNRLRDDNFAYGRDDSARPSQIKQTG